jgi:nucleolar pre-ribosomal-associated protein 1
MNLLDGFGSIPAESKNHNALHKWEKGDIDAAIEQGYVRELTLCLCSEHDDIRRQAAAAISRFMIKVKVGTSYLFENFPY